jgi:hypothetical protein
MKKLIVLLALLCVAMLLLCSCAPADVGNTTGNATGDSNVDDTPKDYTGTFRVGYGCVDITPELGIGLAGMGDDATRRANNVESRLYMTCIAVTDENENTVLLMTSDSIRTETWVCDTMRNNIARELNVPRTHIFSSTTHTHNAPDTIATGYTQLYIDAGLEACKLAMEERKPAEIYVGNNETQGLAFVRHYVMSDGSIIGDNYGTDAGKTYVGHETEIDAQVQLIKFAREDDKDIVLMNFRGHPIISGNGDHTYLSISAGYVDDCRKTMEKTLGCYFAYFQGASGNVNDQSRITSEHNFRFDYLDHGKKLAEYALEVMDELKKVNTGAVEVKTINYTGNVRQDSEEYIQAATLFNNAYKTGKSYAEAIKASGNKCFSHVALSDIKMRQNQGKTMTLEMAAVSIGDVAFISTPWEMFDNTGKNIKDGSPFEQTFVMYLTNGRGKYLPSEPAYSNGCYEKELSYFGKGAAAEIEGLYIDMLKELHKDGITDPAITEFKSQLPADQG